MKGSSPRTLCVKVFVTTGDPVIEEYADVGYQTEGDLLRLWREKLGEPVVTMIDRDSRLHLIPTVHIVKVVIASPEGGAPLRGDLPESDGAIPLFGAPPAPASEAAGGRDESRARPAGDGQSYLDLPPDFSSGVRRTPDAAYLEALRRAAADERANAPDESRRTVTLRGPGAALPGSAGRSKGRLLG